MPERPSQNDSTNQQHRTMRSDDDNFDRNTRVSNTERRDGEDDDENRSKDDDDQVCLFCFFFYELELQQEKIHKCLSLLTKFRMMMNQRLILVMKTMEPIFLTIVKLVCH